MCLLYSYRPLVSTRAVEVVVVSWLPGGESGRGMVDSDLVALFFVLFCVRCVAQRWEMPGVGGF